MKHTASLLSWIELVRVPDPGTEQFHHWVDDLGHNVAVCGIRAFERQVAEVSRLAERHGILRVASAIVADPTAPDVARERALGKVLAAFVRLEAPAPDVAAAA